MNKIDWKKYLPFILIFLGLLLRTIYLLEYSQFSNFDLALGADVTEYDARAREILSGRFFSSTPEIHAPLYSFFLSFIYLISNCSVVIARIVQVLLNFIAFILLTKLLDKYEFPFNFRMIFLAIAMLFPIPIFHQAELVSESLSIVLLTGAFYTLYYAENSQNKKKLLLFTISGCIGGLAAICHPLLSVFFIAETIYQAIKKNFLYCAMLIIGGILVIAPVIVAKSIHYKKFTFIQSNGAFNFYLGNHKDASGTCELRPGLAWRKTHIKAAKIAKEQNISVDKYWWNKSKEFFLNHPIESAMLLGKKFLLVFSGRELISGADPAPLCYRTNIMYYGRLFTWVLFFLSLWGIFLALVRYDQAICGRFFRLYISTVIILTLTVVSGRYRVPIYPAVIFFATTAIFVKNRRLRLYLCILVFFLGIYLYGAFPNNEYGQAKAILGEAKVIKKDYKEGLKLLNEAIALGVDDPANCYNLLGEIEEKNGNFAAAEKLYKEIIKIEPHMPEAWMNLGNLASLNPKRYKEAGFYYNQALQLENDNADIHFNCGLFLLKLNQIDKGEQAFKKALELNKFHAPAANQLGILAFNKKDFITAQKYFYQAYISDKSNQGYKNNLEVVKKILQK